MARKVMCNKQCTERNLGTEYPWILRKFNVLGKQIHMYIKFNSHDKCDCRYIFEKHTYIFLKICLSYKF